MQTHDPGPFLFKYTLERRNLQKEINKRYPDHNGTKIKGQKVPKFEAYIKITNRIGTTQLGRLEHQILARQIGSDPNPAGYTTEEIREMIKKTSLKLKELYPNLETTRYDGVILDPEHTYGLENFNTGSLSLRKNTKTKGNKTNC